LTSTAQGCPSDARWRSAGIDVEQLGDAASEGAALDDT